jgi:hypothetical protein
MNRKSKANVRVGPLVIPVKDVVMSLEIMQRANVEKAFQTIKEKIARNEREKERKK